MKKATLLVFSILLVVCNVFAGSGLRIMESLVMPSRILNQDVKFSVCLPPDYYDGKQSFPVAYLLHGLGDDETAWLEYGRISQYADQALAEGEIVPMIFIMPQGYRTYYVNDYKGSFLYQDMFVKELVPYIDSMFRTIADKGHRALIGYSMGGFGALVLHLKYPDIFGAAVPLSISIRTDEQYMTEDASGWDEQWGRLFGAQGQTGSDRITEYYKQNSPFYIIPRFSPSDHKKFHIYIDNGDKEETLCRSNEELHILMRKLNFPHEFRVRDGGHSFEYWCSALPNALRFISDAFESEPYRGDLVTETKIVSLPDKQIRQMMVSNEIIFAFTPSEYEYTNRLYPVLYFSGNFTADQRKSISAAVNTLIEKNETGPMLVVFLPENLLKQLTTVLPGLESELRIRPGYRFRSLAGYGDTAPGVLSAVINQEQFSSCVLVDGSLQKESISSLLTSMTPEALKKTPLYIEAPDKGSFYEGNGNLHMMLRDKVLKQEYRVSEGRGGVDWMIGGLGGFDEIIRFVAVNFHR
jgi:enterochelin esterase-like enzyme